MAKNSWMFILGMGCLLISGLSIAAEKESYDSVLTPGARLIAGDASKNEFYILDKDEELPQSMQKPAEPAKVVLQKIPHITTPTKRIKTVINTNKTKKAAVVSNKKRALASTKKLGKQKITLGHTKKLAATSPKKTKLQAKIQDKKSHQAAKRNVLAKLAVKQNKLKLVTATKKHALPKKQVVAAAKKPIGKKIISTHATKKIIAMKPVSKNKLAFHTVKKPSVKKVTAAKSTKKTVAAKKPPTTIKKKLALNKKAHSVHTAKS